MKNMRRKGINTTKLGVLFIVSAISLAGLGAAFSAWTDTIYITGEVSTGSVGWHFTEWSGTWVYKDLTNDNEVILPAASVDPNLLEVAHAQAFPGIDDHHVIVNYSNIFPCINFDADVTILYTGSVPGKINSIDFTDPWASDDTEESYDDEVLIDQYTTIVVTIYDEAGNLIYQGDPYLGLQFHNGYTIHIVMTIHLLQDNALMNLFGDFGVSVEIVQWNEYPYEGGECGEEPPIGEHADVMLVLDTSGSIQDYETELKDSANAFVTALLSDDAEVGLVEFNWDAYLLTTFTTNEAALHALINALDAGGNTNLEAAIIMAQNELATADRTPDSTYPDYMVIITDGVPTAGGDPLDDATNAKAAGTTIFVLGIGIPDSTLLTLIASPNQYYDVIDWTDLEAVLLSLVL
jgi:uncharacterized protein YegL